MHVSALRMWRWTHITRCLWMPVQGLPHAHQAGGTESVWLKGSAYLEHRGARCHKGLVGAPRCAFSTLPPGSGTQTQGR